MNTDFAQCRDWFLVAAAWFINPVAYNPSMTLRECCDDEKDGESDIMSIDADMYSFDTCADAIVHRRRQRDVAYA